MSSSTSDKEIIELIDKFFVKSTSLICATKCNRFHTASDLAPQFDEEWLLSETAEDLELPSIIEQWSRFDGGEDLPPLVIETFLDLRRVEPSQWVTLKDDERNEWNVCKGAKKSEIVLERWLIELDKSSASFKSHKPTVEESSGFPGQLILLFRYLYTLIQLLPASDLHAFLCKAADAGVSSPIDVATRILDGSKPILSKGRIGLSKPIISTYSNVVNESNVPSHLEQRKITPVWTRYGLLRISVSYRHDCRFEVHDPEEETPSHQFISESMARRLSANRSPSLSPQGRSSIGSIDNPSYQRKPVAISRQLQVFKVGSVGSVPTSQSQMLMKNPSSSSSAVANLQAQRSNNSPIPINSTIHAQDMHNEATSVGSASKYSSSFGRIRRHSSTKHSEQVERPVKNKQQEDQSDALLDFVRLIDEKPELKLNKNRSLTMDISNSLMRFQNLKPNNDLISENLSLSTSMDPSHASQRRRSSSHSPIPSFSPAMNYPSIPSRFSQTSLNENTMGSRVSSNEISREPRDIHRSSLSSHHGGSSVSSQRHSTIGRDASSYDQRIRDGSNLLPDDDEDDDEDLLMNQAISSDSRLRRHSYAKSMENITSSITRNRLPIPQPSQHSQPITTAVPAFAKLHRPGKNSIELPEAERKKSVPDANSVPEDDEDEDLLFFMSDMSLSKM